ncbi:MAG: MaoC/PaaZ C-terminal domain-containing protein [Myxococcota bacterium]
MALNLDIIGKRSEPLTFTYDWKDAVLYALGIGAQEDELDFLIETSGPKVYPTFAVIPTFEANVQTLVKLGGNLLMVLHGGQKIVLHRPIPPSGKLSTTSVVSAIYDKGKGALVIVDCETVDEKGERLFDNQWQIFYRGEGGFGGSRGPETQGGVPPAREPDFCAEQKTRATQALTYRLSGDLNPVHANPQIAQLAGFPRTILHGLCTMGFAGRAVVKHACGGDPARLRSLEVRFSKIVFPGDTLVTSGWRDGGRVVVQTSTRERGEPVLTNAVAEISG